MRIPDEWCYDDTILLISGKKDMQENLFKSAKAPPRPIWQRTSEPEVVKKLIVKRTMN